MSKKPLPTPEGHPVKYVVSGMRAEDTPAGAFQISNQLSAQITRFHQAARQKNQEATVGSAVQRLPNAILRYTKNNGQENLEVRIATLRPVETVEEPKPVPKQPLPDWCVVDIVIPGSTTIEGNYIILPIIDGVERSIADLEADSIHWIDNSNLLPPRGQPKVLFARDELASFDAAIPNRVASLRFDLRGGEEIEHSVNIYGQVVPASFPITGYTTSYGRTLLYDHTSTGPIDATPVARNYEFYQHVLGGLRPFHDFSPAGFGPYLLSPEGAADKAAFPATEDLVDATSGLIYKHIIRTYPSEDTVDLGNTTCPSDGVTSKHYRETLKVVEYWKVWTITTDTMPIYGTTFAHDADLAYAFYYDLPNVDAWQVGKTPHKDIRYSGVATSWASIWALKPEVPLRKALPQKAHLQYTTVPGNPGNYAFVGKLTVNKKSLKVKFVPAA